MIGSTSPDNRPGTIPIHSQRKAFAKLIVAVTAPSPLFRALHNATRDRIFVTIVQFLHQGVMGCHVEVITADVPNDALIESPNRSRAPTKANLVVAIHLAVVASHGSPHAS